MLRSRQRAAHIPQGVNASNHTRATCSVCLATAYKVVWPAEIEPNLKTPQSCRSEIIPHPTQSAGNRNKLLAFNVKTQQWSDLVSGAQPGAVIDWAHSPDYRYLYYTTGGPEPTTMRIRLADHKSEVIGSFKGLRLAHGPERYPNQRRPGWLAFVHPRCRHPGNLRAYREVAVNRSPIRGKGRSVGCLARNSPLSPSSCRKKL